MLIIFLTNETKRKAEAERQQFEDSVTESTKEAVKSIARGMGDKKSIDTDAEATALAAMLKNSKGDLNKADLQYIRNILSESGYGNYLEDDKKVGDGVTLPKKEDTPAPKDLSEETPKDDASKGYKFLQNKKCAAEKNK